MSKHIMKEEFAVVTGSANGLGNAFANELSKRKVNTILVDLPGTGLLNKCEEYQNKYGTKSIYFECDLSQKENVVELADKINLKYEVNVLINNVGKGGTQRFEKAHVDYINTIIQLNVMATSILTHQLLPNLLKREKSYILNVASMAAFSPIGYKTVYPASKVFVHYFSRGLNEELKNTNVFVGVVNPGAMNTNEELIKRNQQLGFWGKFGLMKPEKVAEKAIRQMYKCDNLIVLNNSNILLRILMKMVPVFIGIPLISRTVKKEILLEEKLASENQQ